MAKLTLSNFRRLFLYVLPLLVSGDSYAQVQQVTTFDVKSSYHCMLQITDYTGNTMSLFYKSLPANQAGANKNSLWLWRASEVPWGYKPMKKQLLPKNATQSGSYVLDGISISPGISYIACYSVDSTEKQICACATLAEKIDTAKDNWIDVQLLQVSSKSLVFSYGTLPGYLPLSYENWFGLWKGAASPYNPFPPMATGKPADDSNSGNAALNGISLEANQTYTLIYFAGKSMTNAAVIITFVVH